MAEHRLDYGSVRVRSVEWGESDERLVKVEASCVCGFALRGEAGTFVDASKMLHESFARHAAAGTDTSA